MSDTAIETAPVKRPRGRSTIFTPEIALEICERLAIGTPLAVICRDEHMPCVATVWKWRETDSVFDKSIARAREIGFDAIASETLEIADDASNDWMERKSQEGEVGGWELNGEHIQRSKVRIETRLKLLAKWDPKRYGERLSVESKTESTVTHLTDQADLAQLSSDQREALRDIANALLERRGHAQIEGDEEQP